MRDGASRFSLRERSELRAVQLIVGDRHAQRRSAASVGAVGRVHSLVLPQGGVALARWLARQSRLRADRPLREDRPVRARVLWRGVEGLVGGCGPLLACRQDGDVYSLPAPDLRHLPVHGVLRLSPPAGFSFVRMPLPLRTAAPVRLLTDVRGVRQAVVVCSKLKLMR